MLRVFGRAIQLLISGDREVFFIAWTSLRLSLVSVVIASLLSLPLGFLIGLKSFRGKKQWSAVLNARMALPTGVVGLLRGGLPGPGGSGPAARDPETRPV